MKAAQWVIGLLAIVLAPAAFAEDEAGSGRRAAPPEKPSWDFALTAYPTIVRDSGNYTSWIGAADRGPLHLEARGNYESVGARSAFVGWTFSGGAEFPGEDTPIIGGAWGTTDAVVPGLEVSLGSGRFDFYIEAEYVRPSDHDSKYLYAWSELGFRPVEWFRAGLAAQRTRAYGSDRDIQRGPFAQVTWRRFTLGGYWFNPGSSNQVGVVSLGAAF